MKSHPHLTTGREARELYAPNGKRIVGTADELLATAHVVAHGRNPDGSIAFECEGESKIHWDTQTQRIERGEPLWTDEDGRDWPQSSLSLEGEPLKPTPAAAPADSLHRLTDREASATIEALRYLQRDMEQDDETTSELTLEEIDALCERLNFDGEPAHAAVDALEDLRDAIRGLKEFGGDGGTTAEEAAELALAKAEELLGNN